MPSLHVAWALWCAIALFTLAERRWVRMLGLLYPACTVFVVLGTANHFILDAVGGVLTLGVGIAAERALSGRHAYSKAHAGAALTVPEPELAAA